MTSPQPSGRRDARDPRWVVFTRHFAAPIDDVWAAVTEPGRLAGWIGTWSGDPASGRIDFFMTAEGDDVAAEPYDIEMCDPPSELLITSAAADGEAWRLRLELVEQDGGTTLAFGQLLTDPEVAASVGPGWEYYLDRLVAAETGGDVGVIDFDGYYPALSEHYRRLVS